MQLTRTIKQRFEIKDRRRITFYPCVFNKQTKIEERNSTGGTDKYVEVIRETAFDETLKSLLEVTANIDHNDEYKFAQRSDGSLILQADPHGLWASCWIPEGDFGDSILNDIKSGKLDGCSFKFGPTETKRNNDITERISVSLHDVCLTANPCYAGTEVTHHRSKTLQRCNYLFARLRLAKLQRRS